VALMRSALLAASQSRWLRERAPRFRFVRRATSRFMPGEDVEAALAAAEQLQAQGIATIFTHLGENITELAEAARVTEHYLNVSERIRSLGLNTEVSVKLTQLGLDISSAQCYSNLKRIVERAGEGNTVWIDMESSKYVDITLELYRRARSNSPNVGICLQAYLYRTAQDVAALMPLGPIIRLVKGAYQEPADIAYRRKADVDENFFKLARILLGQPGLHAGIRTAIATHDPKLIRRVIEFAGSIGLTKDQYEFQMLYGIQRPMLVTLVRERYRARVLIAYGAYWFPWFMRRLAERPANVLFVARNLFSG